MVALLIATLDDAKGQFVDNVIKNPARYRTSCQIYVCTYWELFSWQLSSLPSKNKFGDQFFCFEPLQVLARGLRDFTGFDYIIHEISFRSQFLRGNFFLQLMLLFSSILVSTSCLTFKILRSLRFIFFCFSTLRNRRFFSCVFCLQSVY